jgi:hypothetical protein
MNTLWLFNIAMENGPLIFPAINLHLWLGFSMAMLNNQMVMFMAMIWWFYLTWGSCFFDAQLGYLKYLYTSLRPNNKPLTLTLSL